MRFLARVENPCHEAVAFVERRCYLPGNPGKGDGGIRSSFPLIPAGGGLAGPLKFTSSFSRMERSTSKVRSFMETTAGPVGVADEMWRV